MILYSNPFYLIEATTRDNRQIIMQKSQDKSLEIDPAICSEARLILTNAKKRVLAEVNWCYGVPVKKITEILKQIKSGDFKVDGVNNLPSIAKFNILGTYLSLHKHDAKDLKKHLYSFAVAYKDVDVNLLLKMINEDRAIAGISEIDDINILKSAMENNALELLSSISKQLEKYTEKDLLDVTLSLVEKAIKENLTLTVIDDLIDKFYRLHIKNTVDKKTKVIETKIDEISKMVKSTPTAHKKINEAVESLMKELEKFDAILQPVQLSMQNRGLEHEKSKDIALKARSLAIDLVTIKDNMKTSEKLIQCVESLFKEIYTVKEKVKKDLLDIQDIRKKDDEWKKEIECDIEEKTFFTQNMIHIDVDHILYNGIEYDIKDIKYIKYGVTRKVENGVTSILTKIEFGDEEDNVKIEWMKLENFQKFVNSLWKTAGVHILQAMIYEINCGRSIYNVIFDDGIRVYKSNYYSASESKVIPWTNVSYRTVNGCFVMFDKHDPSYSLVFSYNDDPNTHAIEALIDLFAKNPGNTISETFPIQEKEYKGKKINFSYELPGIDRDDSGIHIFWTIVIAIIILIFIVNS